MSKSKKSAKRNKAAGIPAVKSDSEAASATVKPIIRAIRVSQALLDAAKAYKKATGTSFYTLGFEAISDRLKREGYLKAAEAVAGA